MLGCHYRFKIQNQTGQSIASGKMVVTARRWNFATNGSLNFESAEDTVYANMAAVANNAYDPGTTQDNRTLKWFGGSFMLNVTAPASASGSVLCFYERSTDNGTTWDTNGLGMVVAVNTFAASGQQAVSFSL